MEEELKQQLIDLGFKCPSRSVFFKKYEDFWAYLRVREDGKSFSICAQEFDGSHETVFLKLNFSIEQIVNFDSLFTN